MPKLTYPEATKKAKAEKPPENFMVVQIDSKLVLPYKDGIKLMEALANAEKLDRYSSDPPIEPLEHWNIAAHILSPKDYVRHKTAQLMGVSLSDLEQAEQAAAAAEANNTT